MSGVRLPTFLVHPYHLRGRGPHSDCNEDSIHDGFADPTVAAWPGPLAVGSAYMGSCKKLGVIPGDTKDWKTVRNNLVL
jgi:hypothetical protein